MNTSLNRGLLAALLLLPAAALAHTGAESASFVQGFAHPFGGMDHVLAMLAVGIMASRFNGQQRLMLPLAFVALMIVGRLLGAATLAVPFVESMIALSVVTFGVAIATTRTLNLAVSAALVGSFALFHGHAHSSELAGPSMAAYSAGFVVATAALHGAGLGLAFMVGERKKQAHALRFGGSAVAIAGVALLGASLG